MSFRVKSGIYRIQNIKNEKLYIGSSLNASSRLRGHKKELSINRHNNGHLQRAWNKYGEEYFTFKILLICHRRDLLFYEQRMIDGFLAADAEFGYNIRSTADSNLGHKHTKEFKLSAQARMRGTNNPFYGKTHMEEARKKISAAGKGRIRTPEIRRKIAETSRKRWKNSGHRELVGAKISKAMMGNTNFKKYVYTEERNKKISMSMKGNTNGRFNRGKKHTKEARIKISSAKIGRRPSRSHRQKISKSLHAYWLKNKKVITPAPCLCGCGRMAKPKNKYIHGHHMRRAIKEKRQ